MYKKLLLASSLVAGVSAQAAEYYIVKDGKVADGVELLKAAEGSILSIEEGVEAPGGEGTYLHYLTKVSEVAADAKPAYAGRMFYVQDGIDLDNVWMVDITYFLPEGSTFSGENLKRESMRIDLLGDTLTVADDTFKYDYDQSSRRFAHLGYDIYFRDFYKYNPDKGFAELKNQGVGKERTLSRYMYTNPSFRDALGSRNIAKVVSFAFAPEAPSTKDFVNEVYVKEIKIYSEGVKPFYNEPFHSFRGASYISGDGKIFFRYKDTDGKLAPYTAKSTGYEGADLYGQTYLAGTQLNGLKAGKITASCVRLWQSEGEQCVDDVFYDTEVGIMLNVGSAEDRLENPVYVRVPFNDSVAKPGEKMNVHLMLGHNACSSCAAYGKYEKSVSPLQYRFEKGDLSSYSEATDWAPYTTMDTLPINVNVVDEDIVVPEGGYNIITLGFFPQKGVSYVVGDLQLRGVRSTIPESYAHFEPETVAVCQVSMPYTFLCLLDGIETVESDGLEIYPNPAENEFFVPADVVKVEVISIAGNVVLSTNSTAVNVKGLAKGMYVVKAYTESGVKTARIIKK